MDRGYRSLNVSALGCYKGEANTEWLASWPAGPLAGLAGKIFDFDAADPFKQQKH